MLLASADESARQTKGASRALLLALSRIDIVREARNSMHLENPTTQTSSYYSQLFVPPAFRRRVQVWSPGIHFRCTRAIAVEPAESVQPESAR
jgi:hypothetical protein